MNGRFFIAGGRTGDIYGEYFLKRVEKGEKQFNEKTN